MIRELSGKVRQLGVWMESRVYDWLLAPRRWRGYVRFMREHEVMRARFHEHAVKLGYGGWDYLESAVEISKRCENAEAALGAIAQGESLTEIPGLCAGEIERLAWLAEECGEVLQAAGKILRHGYAGQSPYGSLPNRVALERELGHVRAAMDMLHDARDIRIGSVNAWRHKKREHVGKWMHHQCGREAE